MLRAPARVAIALLCTAAGAVAAGCAGSSPAAAPPAPPLPRAALVGPRVTLASLRGRPAVINFWASWCGPCNREAPALEAFARDLRGRARLVGVNWNEGAAGARAFVRKYHWTFSNVRDGDGRAGNAYHLLGLPTTFVLDRSGHIVKQLTGPQSVASIRAALRGAS